MRARADQDAQAPPRRSFHIDAYVISKWFRRLFWLAVLGGLIYGAVILVEPVRQELSAERIAARLSSELGVPVKVAATEIRLTPSPRFVLVGVQVDRFALGDLWLRANWGDAMRLVMSERSFSLGEVNIDGLVLNGETGVALLAASGSLLERVPMAVNGLRFNGLSFPDLVFLPGRYDAFIRRDASGRFGPIEIESVGTEGTLRLQLVPKRDDRDGVLASFQMDGARWSLPLGPALKWNEVRASGTATASGVRMDALNLNANNMAVLQGTWAASNEGGWTHSGTLRVTNVDMDGVYRYARGLFDAPPGSIRFPVQGVATMEGAFSGRGASLNEALAASQFTGAFVMKAAALNGVNLGVAISQPAAGTSGGSTRFSELAGKIAIGANGGVALRGIDGRAGTMSVRGEVDVNPSLTLNGYLDVDLGVERVKGPVRLRVLGSANAPQYAR